MEAKINAYLTVLGIKGLRANRNGLFQNRRYRNNPIEFTITIS
jgi:hypothetical protein